MENKEKYHKFQMLLFLLLYNAVCFIWASGVGGYSEWSVIGSSMESEFLNNFLCLSSLKSLKLLRKKITNNPHTFRSGHR